MSPLHNKYRDSLHLKYHQPNVSQFFFDVTKKKKSLTHTLVDVQLIYIYTHTYKHKIICIDEHRIVQADDDEIRIEGYDTL